MSKKTRIIIGISISIIIVISLAISIYIPNKNKIKEEIEDNSISYYLLKKEENYGVINQDGEIVIEPQYEEITIPNQNKAVFICQKEDEEKILNEHGKKIFTQYTNVQAIELTNIIKENAYEKNVLKYEKDGKYGLIGINGEIVVEAKYQEISSLGYKEGEILVKENNKYGIIDYKGNQIIKSNFDSIKSDEYYSTEYGYKKSGYIVCNTTKDGYRYGYYDYEGGKILDTEYNQISRITEVNSNDIYLVASKNGQYGVFINNNKIINTQYQSISYYDSIEMFVVERTGKYGVVNKKGLEIIGVEYTDIQIKGIYIYAKKDEEQKVFNHLGQIVDISFDTIIEATNNKDYYIKNDDGYYTILNSELQEIVEQKYTYIEYAYDKYFIVTNEDGKSGVIDSEGKSVIKLEYDLVQIIKEKNIIQVMNFEEDISQIYNVKMECVLEIKDMNIQKLNDYVKIYNAEDEYYLDNNGYKIEDEAILEQIKKSNAILKIGDFKRVTYGVEQYYYIEDK